MISKYFKAQEADFLETWADGQSLANMELEKKNGVPVMAIRHQEQTLFDPRGNLRIFANDLALLMWNFYLLMVLKYLLEKGPKGDSIGFKKLTEIS